MLERDAGPASEGWVRQLETGEATVRDIVRGIVMSPEHMQRVERLGAFPVFEQSVAQMDAVLRPS